MQKLIKGLFLGFLAISVLLFVSHTQAKATKGSSNSARQIVKAPRLAAAEGTAADRASKASELKQAACEVHRKVINLRQNNIISHTERVADRLGKLTAAVEKFYTDKLVPQGKLVVNYDALVANVGVKQTALTTALAKIKTDTEGLTCEKDQAKGQFATFRTDTQTLIKTIKDYRLSILQLMQAVKKAAGTSVGGAASGSAKEVAK